MEYSLFNVDILLSELGIFDSIYTFFINSQGVNFIHE